MNKVVAIAVSAASLLLATQASATVLTFDDVAPLSSDQTYPSDYQGPIGFTDDGFQFSDNEVVYNVSGIANGPAYSGTDVAFNDYSGYGDFTGPNAFYTTVTAVGGGDFSFTNVYLQSFSHSAGDSISGLIEGYSGSTLVGIQFFNDVKGWTEVSAAGAVGSFSNISSLVIEPTDYTEIDNLQVNAVTSAAPEPSTWALMIAGLGISGGMLRFGRRRGLAAAV